MREAMSMSMPSIRQLRELGYPMRVAEGVIEAIKHYDDIDIDHYEFLLREALSYISIETADPGAQQQMQIQLHTSVERGVTPEHPALSDMPITSPDSPLSRSSLFIPALAVQIIMMATIISWMVCAINYLGRKGIKLFRNQ